MKDNRKNIMVDYTTSIAESNNFIILDKYSKDNKVTENYQSEDELERELVHDLENPATIQKLYTIQCLQLNSHITQHFF
jgi:hypothetical protein